MAGIGDLLPELYGPADRGKKKGGMCKPGEDCGPAARGSGFDIVKILTGVAGTPSEKEKDAAGKRAAAPDADDAGDDPKGGP